MLLDDRIVRINAVTTAWLAAEIGSDAEYGSCHDRKTEAARRHEEFLHTVHELIAELTPLVLEHGVIFTSRARYWARGHGGGYLIQAQSPDADDPGDQGVTLVGDVPIEHLFQLMRDLPEIRHALGPKYQRRDVGAATKLTRRVVRVITGSRT